MSRDIRRLGLTPDPSTSAEDDGHQQSSLVIFILCVPAGYLLDGHGTLFLLAIPAAGLARQGWRALIARRARVREPSAPPSDVSR